MTGGLGEGIWSEYHRRTRTKCSKEGDFRRPRISTTKHQGFREDVRNKVN